MFKTGLSKTVFGEFVSNYQSISERNNLHSPSFYADENGIRLVTNVLDVVNKHDSELCAMTIAEDGWVEIFSLDSVS